MAQIGVLAQLAQQAHENVTREQNFRSALFQQAEQNVQSSRQLRISEMNAINGAISNIIRGQENNLLKQQNQERLEQQTQSLIDYRNANIKDAQTRTQLAVDAQRLKEQERQAELDRKAKANKTVSDMMQSLGLTSPPQASTQSIPTVRLEDKPQEITSPPAEGGLGESIAAMAQSEPTPEPMTVKGMGPKGPTTALPTGNQSPPNPNLFPLPNRAGEVVPAGPRAATPSEVSAANDLRIADATVNKKEVGEKGNEVTLKSPGVDPEQTAKTAVAQANKAGVQPNPVPGPTFVNYPETVEQQQINEDFIQEKRNKLGVVRAALEIDINEGDGSNRAALTIAAANLASEIAALEKRNTFKGESNLSSEDTDLIADYEREFAVNPDFIEFTNTKSGVRLRRDQFINQMAARGTNVINMLKKAGIYQTRG